MKKYFKQLGRDSVIYGFGGALKGLVGLLMLPVITRLFSAGEIGVIEMFLMICGIFSGFLVLSVNSGKFFYYYKQDSDDYRREIIKSYLVFVFAWGIPLTVLALALSGVWNAWFFEGAAARHLFVIAFAAAFFQGLAGSMTQTLRLQFRPGLFVALNILLSLTMYGSIIFLVWTLGLGVAGYLWGMLIAYMAVAAVGGFILRRWLTGGFSWPLLKKMIAFGLPLFPTTLAIWVMTSADRLFLLSYSGMEEVGIYGIGARFSMVVGAATLAFRTAWAPIAYNTAREPDANRFFALMAQVYLFLGSAGVLLLNGIAPWALRVFTQPEFYGGYVVVGLLAYGAVFYGFFTISGLGSLLGEKTAWNTVAFFISAGLNVVLNWLMVPTWGMLGAAVATMTAYIAGNVFVLYIGERIYYIGFNISRLTAITVVTLGGMAVQLFVFSLSMTATRQSIAIGATCLVSTALLLLFGIGISDMKRAAAMLRSRLSGGAAEEG